MRLRIAQSTAVFTRPGSVWLPRVSIFERFASWTELWLWWRGHPHDKWLVRTARQTVNFSIVICVSDFLITYWSTLVHTYIHKRIYMASIKTTVSKRFVLWTTSARLSECRRQAVPYFSTGGWEKSIPEPSVCLWNDTGSDVSSDRVTT